VTVRTVINTNRASLADLKSLGREDGAHLFAVFEKLFEADGNSIATAKYDIFETWYKLQILECQLRMHGAGMSDADIARWQRACVAEMQRRLGKMRERCSNA
jgi:hypothetical protein